MVAQIDSTQEDKQKGKLDSNLHGQQCQGARSASGTVVIARSQTAGRGQRGRVWTSEPGGLYLSLALEPDWPVRHSAQLTCMSAWGIATAFNNLGIPLKIKWPNDLFFEGKKLGGILTETKLVQSLSASSAESPSSRNRSSQNRSSQNSHSQDENRATRIKQAVIGVGINWENSVPDTGITLQKIMAQLPECAAQNKINCLEMLSALILKGILQGYLFQQQVGSQVFMKAYSNLLTQVGKVVSLNSDLLNLAVTDEHFSQPAGSSPFSASPFSTGRLSTDNFSKKGLRDRPISEQLLKPLSGEPSPANQRTVDQFLNRSGEIIGVSEEGYLKVAVLKPKASDAIHRRAGPARSATADTTDYASQAFSSHSPGCNTNILLLKPSEICIS